MIISRQYALKLISKGKAEKIGLVINSEIIGEYFVAIDRYDQCRTDHYHATESDINNTGRV